MTTTTARPLVTIIPNDKGNPPGKLADAELTFPTFDDAARQTLQSVLAVTYSPTQDAARATQDAIRLALALEGMRLIGFAIWERRTGGARNVTFPARSYAVNGERRSFALLRPQTDPAASEHVRDLILAAYAEYEQQQTAEPPPPEPVPAAPIPPPSTAAPAPAGLF